MRISRYALSVPVALLSLAACSLGTGLPDDAQMALDPSLPFVTTDQDSYEVTPGQIEVAGGTFSYFKFTVRLTYTNRSSQPVYVECSGAREAIFATLERLSADQWEVAWHQGGPLCGGRRPRIDPGGSYTREFRVEPYDPDAKVTVNTQWGLQESRFGSPWLPEALDGKYRVNWSAVFFTAQWDGRERVPVEQAVSNTFELTGEIPWERAAG